MANGELLFFCACRGERFDERSPGDAIGRRDSGTPAGTAGAKTGDSCPIGKPAEFCSPTLALCEEGDTICCAKGKEDVANRVAIGKVLVTCCVVGDPMPFICC